MIIPSRLRTPSSIAALLAAFIGAIVARQYHRLGLTLSHYDARGHVVVARRIIDSITPGWQQIGAVWLPLPHLLNMIPVQVDPWYRSGASAVAISVCAFAIATGAIVWIVQALCESSAAAALAAAVFVLNPNVLYLQATPMTEPLLLASTTVAVALLMAWCRSQRLGIRDSGFELPFKSPFQSSISNRQSRLVGIAFALACLTRYEAWPVTASALAAAVWVLLRSGAQLRFTLRRVGAIAFYPALAGVAFLAFSRVVIGQWFVSSGFFVPENKSLGRPVLAAAEIWWGVHTLSGYLIIAVAIVGLIALGAMGLLSRRRSDGAIPLSLMTTAALPWSAFVGGHPFRIRYIVPLIAIEAIGVGAAVGLVRRLRIAVAVVVLVMVAYELRPLDANAPMVVEAQWDRPNGPVRQRVTDFLRAAYGGEKIMASMGSLGHYMQEASRDGFAIRDFLHEGNGDIWLAALEDPRPYVGWILIEEKANGGDMLAKLAREKPQFLDGFSRVAEGAGLALYRRSSRQNLILARNK